AVTCCLKKPQARKSNCGKRKQNGVSSTTAVVVALIAGGGGTHALHRRRTDVGRVGGGGQRQRRRGSSGAPLSLQLVDALLRAARLALVVGGVEVLVLFPALFQLLNGGGAAEAVGNVCA